MYSLWNANFFDIGTKKEIPFKFTINGKEEEQSKFKIEELDYLTASYKNEEAFLLDLVRYGDKYIRKANNKPIIITHSSKGKVYEDSVIYDDNLILVAAAKKRNSKATGQKYLMKNNEIMLSFLKEIKEIAQDDYASSYLLNPLELSDTIPLRLKTIMKNELKESTKVYDKKTSTYKSTPKGIKDYLKEYVTTKKAIETNTELFQSTLYLDEKLDDISDKINTIFRTDYLTLRNLVAWENNFIKALEIRKVKATDKKEQASITYNIKRVKLAKDFRNNRITKNDYEEKLRTIREERNENIKSSSKKH